MQLASPGDDGVTAPWSSTSPYPPARTDIPLGDDHRRLRALVDGPDWIRLDWPAFLDALTTVGRTDIPGSRLAEGHIDALRILEQAGRRPVPDALYGVWASRSRGGGLTTTPATDGDDRRLTGTVPFASGVGLIDRALVTAVADDGRSLLFDADVRDWPFDETGWRTTAMAQSRSFTVTVLDQPVSADSQIGPVGFYLERPGFFPGGVGVAAVWAGGAARVADLVAGFLGCSDQERPDRERAARLGSTQHGHLGRMRTELVTIGAVITAAGARLPDLLAAERPDPAVLQSVSTEARAAVGSAVRRLLDIARTLAGPAGLAQEPGLGDAIADLDLYVRQQHADRDAEYLGSTLPGSTRA